MINNIIKNKLFKLSSIIAVVLLLGSGISSVADDNIQSATVNFSAMGTVSSISEEVMSISDSKGSDKSGKSSYELNIKYLDKIETNTYAPLIIGDIKEGDKIIAQGLTNGSTFFIKRIISFTSIPSVVATSTDALATTTATTTDDVVSTSTSTTTDEIVSTSTSAGSGSGSVTEVIVDTIDTSTTTSTTTEEIVSTSTATTTEEGNNASTTIEVIGDVVESAVETVVDVVQDVINNVVDIITDPTTTETPVEVVPEVVIETPTEN